MARSRGSTVADKVNGRPEIGLLLALTFSAGFGMMAIELTATRLLAPFFGSTTYLWTNVIAAIMAALAAGYYVGGRLADRHPSVRLAGFLATLAGTVGLLVPDGARLLASHLIPETASEPAAIPATVPASLLVALIVFAPPVFLLGMLNPLLVKLLASRTEVGWAAGANAAASTAGAILGTFSPTLWLVPTIGSRKTVITCMLPLLVLAAVILARRRAWRRSTMALLITMAGLVTLAGGRHPILPGPDLVTETETAYQYVRVERRGEKLAITIDGKHGTAQSVVIPGRYLTGESIYDHLAAVPLLLGRKPASRLDVLILGYGGGTLARQLVHFYGRFFHLHVDGVEIDPGLLSLGSRYLSGNTGDGNRVRIHVGDARTWLAGSRNSYDLIVLDVFSRRALVPFHLATNEFFSLVGRHMKPDGLLAMNFVLPAPDSLLFRYLHATLASAVGPVGWFRVPDSMNLVVLASRRSRVIPGRGETSLRALENAGWREVQESSDLARTAERGWRHLVTDAPTPPVPPLTDDLAPVEDLFLRDLRAHLGG